MRDITFCITKDCKRKQECRRSIDNYKDEELLWVSVSDFQCTEEDDYLYYEKGGINN